MSNPSSTDSLRISDAAVVARYLQLRSHLNDKVLARVEQYAIERYQLVQTRRLVATLTTQIRSGFQRPDGGEIWPVVFLTAVDISVALCVQLSPEWLAGLGTTLNGPSRLRHRLWEDWWGWEKSLSATHPTFFELPAADQEEALVHFFRDGMEWLATHKLMAYKAG